MPTFFFHIAIDLARSPETILCPTTDIFQTLNNKSQSACTKGWTHTRKKSPQCIPEEKFGASVHRINGLSIGLGGDSGHFASVNHNQQQQHSSTPTGSSISNDWRCDSISLQRIDMLSRTTTGDNEQRDKLNGHITNGLGAGSGGLATKGGYEPTELEEDDLGWGVVRLYRDAEETPGLYDEVASNKSSKHGRGVSRLNDSNERPSFKDEDCTTLCILAVPSYLTPSDFLGFVGEKTREEVSHFRMIRTERGNRYMVLMKFRSGKKAREWGKEWNGKVFNSMEPENCHVVFVKSIEFRALENTGQASSFPDMTNDPFTPSKSKTDSSTALSAKGQLSSLPSTSLNTKPLAPPTPALVELPTCPVCLERMDESTGLLTILCQHVFHCSCLQKWRGSGCPVCRYTQDDLSKRLHSSDVEAGLNECAICRSDSNLWICLICGAVGCGRYDAAHAFLHYQESSHCFAMDLTTQRVWDYASDGYVHRIVQNKTDGKLLELPSTNDTSLPLDDITDDYLPREKLGSIGLEYTHLLTSQLESQRLYFEEKVERAADKASQATSAATKASESASEALSQLQDLQAAHDNLIKDIIPTLERDRDRALRKAEKFEGMARKLEKEWREEKALGGSLMERVQLLDSEAGKLRLENAELKEQNRDLGFFISGAAKLREAGLGEEVVEGTVSLPEVEKGPGGRKKGKGKSKT
ncbi:hypothetical protein MMC26_000154 [Xylographa opegraphella]|nr:hypothetical protein [Xylographa opegraphella]